MEEHHSHKAAVIVLSLSAVITFLAWKRIVRVLQPEGGSAEFLAIGWGVFLLFWLAVVAGLFVRGTRMRFAVIAALGTSLVVLLWKLYGLVAVG